MKNNYLITAIAIYIITICTSFAKPIDAAKLQQFASDYLKTYRTEEYISGIAITIQTSNDIKPISAYAGTVGFDHDKHVTKKSLFQIGSITKSFTTAILLQIEANKKYHFSIDDHLGKYFPEYKAWSTITIRQLMNMSSGIPNYTSNDKFIMDFQAHPYSKFKPTNLLAYAENQPLLFAPGTNYQYSNTNYILLGMLIEKLTGHTLTDEMYDRIIHPLHLTQTYYITHVPDKEVMQDVVHLYMNGGNDTKNFSLSSAGAAGAAISTTEEISTWARALFTPGKVLKQQQFNELNQIISMKNGKTLVTPSKDDSDGFGLGIVRRYLPKSGELAYTYEGGTIGGRAIYMYVPTQNISIAITLNSHSEKDNISVLMMNIYNYLIS